MLRLTALAAAALLFACSALAQDAEQTRSAVLIMEKPAGVQTSTVAADGSRNLSYEYNDRGRGPKLNARVRLDAASVPVSIEMDGVDYIKAPVSERFTLANGLARWKNSAEAGEQKLGGRAFYLSTQGFPEELGWLAHALLQAPGQRMALLPAGEATIKRAVDLNVGDGAKKRHVTAYLIEGLGFSPSTVWLDDDQKFFASVDRFYSVVREGWEASVPKLLEKQEALASARTVDLARALTRKPKQPVAITNANVFDAATGQSAAGHHGADRWQSHSRGRQGRHRDDSIAGGAHRRRRQSAATRPVGHARSHRADRRLAAHGRRRHIRARSRERQRRVAADQARHRERHDDRTAHHDARLHGRPRPVHGADQGVRRHRGRGAQRDRELREARLRRHQGLQLDQARADADDHQARARRRACASAATCRRS